MKMFRDYNGMQMINFRNTRNFIIYFAVSYVLYTYYLVFIVDGTTPYMSFILFITISTLLNFLWYVPIIVATMIMTSLRVKIIIQILIILKIAIAQVYIYGPYSDNLIVYKEYGYILVENGKTTPIGIYVALGEAAISAILVALFARITIWRRVPE